MDLVVHHMLEALVVGRAQEDLGVDLAPVEATVHDLVATGVVTEHAEHVGYLLHVARVVEGCCVSLLPLVRRYLPIETVFTLG